MSISKKILLICIITPLMSNSSHSLPDIDEIITAINAYQSARQIDKGLVDQNQRDEIVTFENLKIVADNGYAHKKLNSDSHNYLGGSHLSDSCLESLDLFLASYSDFITNMMRESNFEACSSCLRTCCKCVGEPFFKKNMVLQSQLLDVVLTFANQTKPIDLLDDTDAWREETKRFIHKGYIFEPILGYRMHS